MADNGRLGRIIKLIGRNPGITLSKLQRALQDEGIVITERTLAKDVLSLKTDFGLLPNRDRLRSGYFLQDLFTLSESEIKLVLDAMHVFGARLDDPEAVEMMERLSATTSDGTARTPSRTFGHRNIYRRASNQKEIESILLQAMSARLPVTISYRTPRLTETRQFQSYPLLMVFHERGWYCIMRDLEVQNYFPRRMDRIKTCSLLKGGEANESHHDDVKDAQFLMNCGWGMTFPANMEELKMSEREPEIVVRFNNTMAPFIMEAANRHPRGKAVPCKDGTGDVEFRIRLSNPREFQNWVRSFGSKAWIVAPQSLVENEKAEIRRMAERYE